MSVHKLTAGGGYTYLTRQVAAADATARGHSGLADYYAQKGETPGVWIGRGVTALDAETVLAAVAAAPRRAPEAVPTPGLGEGVAVTAPGVDGAQRTAPYSHGALMPQSPLDPAADVARTRSDAGAATVATSVGTTHQGSRGGWMPRLRPGVAVGATVTETQMHNLFGLGLHPDADEITRVLAAQRRGVVPIGDAIGLGTPYRVFDNADDFSVRTARAFREHNKARGLTGDTPVPEGDRAAIRTAIARTMFFDEHGREPADARELSGHLARVSRQKTTAVAGYDFTFSPVKSVSTLWAVAPRDISEAVATAHADTVADTVAWLEDRAAYTRTGRDGVAQVEVTGLVATAFTHRDSRAGDPDLHTHVAVSNKVRTLDGRWLALDGRAVFANAVAASEHYNTRLEALLVDRLGVSFAERDDTIATTGRTGGQVGGQTGGAGRRAVREIVGIDGPLPRLWSSRRTAIDARRAELSAKFQADHGRPPSPKEAIALAQQANLATRADKHEPRSHAEQRAGWRAEAIAVLGDEPALSRYVADALTTTPATDAGAPSRDDGPTQWALATAQAVIATVQQTRATWKQHHVRAEAERAARTAGIALADVATAVEEVTERALAEMSIRLDPHSTGTPVGPAATDINTGPTDPVLTPTHDEHPGRAGEARLPAREHDAAAAADALLPAALTRSDGTSVYTVAGSTLFTSPAVIDAEQRILAAAGRVDGRTVTDPDVEVALVESIANGVELNPGQVALVRALATNPARVQLALAPAGTGKTTAMRVLARAWTTSTPATARPGGLPVTSRATGPPRVVGLAPSAAAASVLRNDIRSDIRSDIRDDIRDDIVRTAGDQPDAAEGGRPPGHACHHVAAAVNADTIAKLLFHVRDGSADSASAPGWIRGIDAATLVIIDEAGMAGTVDLADTIDSLLDRGATVRLVGDDQQLAAIGAGGVLRDLAHTHGAVTLSQVIRFTDPETGAPNHAEGAASLALREGDPAAIAYYTDHARVHVGDLTTATDLAYTAWQQDRTAGRDSIMIAPTTDLVTGLNTRAREDRIAARTRAGRLQGPAVTLDDGTRASAGDTIVTRRNDRRLPITATDWVKNGDLWTVTSVHDDGALAVLHGRTGRHITLPAGYVTAHVALGYASTVHAAQGVTADTCHTVATGAESRQLLYVAMTRGRHANHLYLTTAGDGDEHTTTAPDTLIPPTAVDILTRVLSRDASPTSAATAGRELADPATRLKAAADRYYDSLVTAAERILGPHALAAIHAAAEHALPGLTIASAWPTLRAHLALLALDGTPATAALAHAIGGDTGSRRSFTDARDPAAVLDWRLDPTGRHSRHHPDARTTPVTREDDPASDPDDPSRLSFPTTLAWFPAVPHRVATDADWGRYLTARATHLRAATDVVRAQAQQWTPTSAPDWATPMLGIRSNGPAGPAGAAGLPDGGDAPPAIQADAALVTDLAIWRAANGVTDTDLRPTGPPRLAAADARAQARLDSRVSELIGRADTATTRWKPLAEHLNTHLTADPYWPQLAAKLAVAERAGIDVTTLVTTAARAAPLPDEQPAAALWWRLAAHLVTGAVTATSNTATATLRPDWTPVLADVIGARAADRVLADPGWPSLVAAVNLARRAGWDPSPVLSTAHDLLLDGQPNDTPLRPAELATALAWRVRLLTDSTTAPTSDTTARTQPANSTTSQTAPSTADGSGNDADAGTAGAADPVDLTVLGVTDDGTRDDAWLASLTPPEDEDEAATYPSHYGAAHDAPDPTGADRQPARTPSPSMPKARWPSDSPPPGRPDPAAPAPPQPVDAPPPDTPACHRLPAARTAATPVPAAATSNDAPVAAHPHTSNDPWALPADFDYAAALAALADPSGDDPSGNDPDAADAESASCATGDTDDHPDDPSPTAAAPAAQQDSGHPRPGSPDTRPPATADLPGVGELAGALFLDHGQATADTVTRRELLRLNTLTADFYADHYTDVWAAGYVHERLGTDLVDDPRFPLGYAPDGWTHLVDHLRARGAHDQDLLAAGLATTASNGRLIDRFRDRLIIPIRNSDEIHGFIARRNPDHDHDDPQQSKAGPKYLNTADTLVFSKGREMFGLAENAAALAAGATPTLVEGPLDAIAITLAGDGDYVGVAPLGTALTTHQTDLLLTHVRRPRTAGAGANVADSDNVGDPPRTATGRPDIVVGTDNDRAGHQAAHRAFWQLAPHRITATHLLVPAGKDPAELLHVHGPHALRHALATARPLAETLITTRVHAHHDQLQWAEGQVNAARSAAAVIAALPVSQWPEHIARVVDRTGVTPVVALLEVTAAARTFDDNPHAAAAQHATWRLPASTPLPEAEPLPPTVRWVSLAERAAPGIITDRYWQRLAESLDRADAAGYDVTRLPQLAAAYRAPTANIGRHLTEILVQACPAAADRTRHLSQGFGTSPERSAADIGPAPRLPRPIEQGPQR